MEKFETHIPSCYIPLGFSYDLRKGVLNNRGCPLHFDVPCNRGAAPPDLAAYLRITAKLGI